MCAPVTLAALGVAIDDDPSQATCDALFALGSLARNASSAKPCHMKKFLEVFHRSTCNYVLITSTTRKTSEVPLGFVLHSPEYFLVLSSTTRLKKFRSVQSEVPSGFVLYSPKYFQGFVLPSPKYNQGFVLPSPKYNQVSFCLVRSTLARLLFARELMPCRQRNNGTESTPVGKQRRLSSSQMQQPIELLLDKDSICDLDWDVTAAMQASTLGPIDIIDQPGTWFALEDRNSFAHEWSRRVFVRLPHKNAKHLDIVDSHGVPINEPIHGVDAGKQHIREFSNEFCQENEYYRAPHIRRGPRERQRQVTTGL